VTLPSVFPVALFGISRHVPLVESSKSSSSLSSASTTAVRRGLHGLRAGAVVEPETLADVEALLVKAGSEGHLVVIDFSATW
jgi:hypothetical protein